MIVCLSRLYCTKVYTVRRSLNDQRNCLSLTDLFCLKGCPRNWLHQNGFCYLNTKYSMPYDKGQHFCEYFLDSSLVDVSDERENKLISNLTSSKAWLRFRRCHNKRFFWTDSQPANFTAWESGQPDNKGTDEQCVFISRNGNWSDGICLERKAFVCQKCKFAT